MTHYFSRHMWFIQWRGLWLGWYVKKDWAGRENKTYGLYIRRDP